MPITFERYCIFCRIIAGQAPADVLHDSERVPREHMTQEQLWESDLLAEVGRVASEVGREHCPNGYRLVSNAGWEAKQSQEHAHIHVLGGTFLGDYVNPGGFW